MSACDHQEWVYPPSETDDWSGETVYPEPYQRSIQVDISLGSFKCQRCGEVGYYTGQWKRFFEEGIPCAGSDQVQRNPTPP